MMNENVLQTPEDSKIIRVYKYRRVSTSRQVKKGDSLQDQDDVLDKYISDHPNMICVGEFVDGGVSGRKIKRDDFAAMMKGVRNNEVDLIIFTRLDRWFRNTRHYLNTNATLQEHNVEWLAVEQPYYDTRTAAGRAFVVNSMAFAEFLAENNSETIKEHNKAKVERGEVLSGSTPLGYKVENKHLVFSDQHYILVEVLDEWRTTHSMNHCLRFLLENHGISMCQANFKVSILQNEKIAGRSRGNKDYCPATITWEEFQENQRLLKMNVKSNLKRDYIFSSLVVCDDCDHVMTGCQQRSYSRGKRYMYNAYRCRYGVTVKTCPNKKIMLESTLEKYILKNVKPELEKYITEYECEQLPVKNNRAKRQQLEKKIDRLKDLYLNELISIDEFKIDRAALLEQLEKLEDDESPQKDLSSLKAFLESDFESIYSTLDIPEKRLLWRSVIKQIRIDHDKNITIIFL